MIITSVNLPFLGSRESDHLPFQYLLQEISREQIVIAMPAWVMNREILLSGDVINYHIPFCLNEFFFTRGKIVSSTWDPELHAQIFATSVLREEAIYPHVFINIHINDAAIDLQDFSGPAEDLLDAVLKESILIKKGVLIFLNHLIPYFSRIGDYPRKDYPLLKDQFFQDIKTRLEQNIKNLENCRDSIARRCCRLADITQIVDLEELRTWMESEIYSELFSITFDNDQVFQYIKAIKAQENKLYDNYNAMVMLYLRAL